MCFKRSWDMQDREKASWEEDEDEEENEEFDRGFVNFLLQIDGLQEAEEHDWGLLCHHQRRSVDSGFTAYFKGRATFKTVVITMYSILHAAMTRKHC